MREVAIVFEPEALICSRFTPGSSGSCGSFSYKLSLLPLLPLGVLFFVAGVSASGLLRPYHQSFMRHHWCGYDIFIYYRKQPIPLGWQYGIQCPGNLNAHEVLSIHFF